MCIEILSSGWGVLEHVGCDVKAHQVVGGIQIEQAVIATCYVIFILGDMSSRSYTCKHQRC